MMTAGKDFKGGGGGGGEPKCFKTWAKVLWEVLMNSVVKEVPSVPGIPLLVFMSR